VSARAEVLERHRPKLTARAALLAALVLSAGIASIVPVREYLEQRTQIAGLERRAAALRAANDELQAEMRKLHDPAYLERLARECLGMVLPGEIAFVTVDGPGSPSIC